MIIGLTSFGVRLLCPGTDTAVAADAATKGATDAAAAGATDAAAVGATDVAAAGATDAALAGTAAAAGEATLPEVAVTASALPAAGAGAGALAPALAGAAGVGAGLATGGGGATPAGAAPSGTTPTSPSTTSAAPADAATGLLTATSPADITSIDPATASMLGIDSGGGSIAAGGGAADAGTVLDPVLSEDPSMLEALGTDSSGNLSLGGDQGGGIMSWLKNPKNALTAGMLGVSGLNALFPPQLPGAAKTALGAAGPAVQNAEMVIQTGGQGSPLWAGQKASIDASINQQIQQQTEALTQAAANAGEQGPGVPSGVLTQQVDAMKQQMEVARKELYQQALDQIVNQAVQELSGADQVLMAIANEQLALTQEARQSAGQTAELALLLQTLGG